MHVQVGGVEKSVRFKRLQVAFRTDCWDELECAWTLNEMLADLYANTDRPAAEADLVDSHHHADAFDVAEKNRLARTLRTWQPELLAYFDDGPTEGTNRIIKAVELRQLPLARPVPLRTGKRTNTNPNTHSAWTHQRVPLTRYRLTAVRTCGHPQSRASRSCSMSPSETGLSDSGSSITPLATPLTLFEVALQPAKS